MNMKGAIIVHILATVLVTSGISLVLVDALTGTYDTVMSSWTDHNEGQLAHDGDHKTCAITGSEVGPWWKIDLGRPRLVTRVGLQGYTDAFQVRVGNKTKSLEDRTGFAKNPVCVFKLELHADNMTYFRCGRPRHGQFLSFHIVDPAYPTSLKLCEIDIEYLQ